MPKSPEKSAYTTHWQDPCRTRDTLLSYEMYLLRLLYLSSHKMETSSRPWNQDGKEVLTYFWAFSNPNTFMRILPTLAQVVSLAKEHEEYQNASYFLCFHGDASQLELVNAIIQTDDLPYDLPYELSAFVPGELPEILASFEEARELISKATRTTLTLSYTGDPETLRRAFESVHHLVEEFQP